MMPAFAFGYYSRNQLVHMRFIQISVPFCRRNLFGTLVQKRTGGRRTLRYSVQRRLKDGDPAFTPFPSGAMHHSSTIDLQQNGSPMSDNLWHDRVMTLD